MVRYIRAIGLFLTIAGAIAVADKPKPVSYELTTPVLNEESRTWTNQAKTKAVVGTLLGRQNGKFRIQRVDGGSFVTDPINLSVDDRAYATYATEPRVNPESDVRIGKVVNIMDGDTIQVRTIGEENISVRLIGIDAPEKGQDFGDAAKDFLGNRIHEKTVRVEIIETDRYQRHLADVYAEDVWLNYELARNGYAWHYKKYSKDERIADAEQSAKSEGIGIWSRKDLIAPWDWRNGKRPEPKKMAAVAPVVTKPSKPEVPVPSIRETDTQVYVTETGTKYHRDGCRHLRKSRIPIPLSRAVSAYDACKVCRPPTK